MLKLLLSIILLSIGNIFPMHLEILCSQNKEARIKHLLEHDLHYIESIPTEEFTELEKVYHWELCEEKKALVEKKKKLQGLEEEHFPQPLSFRPSYYIAIAQRKGKPVFYQINRKKDVERLARKLTSGEFTSLKWGQLENGSAYTIILGRKTNKLICLDQTSFPEHTENQIETDKIKPAGTYEIVSELSSLVQDQSS